jgi:hypothetical protein
MTKTKEKDWSYILTDKHIPPRKNAAVAYDLVHQVYIIEERVSSSYSMGHYVITNALQLMIVCFLLLF